MKTLREKNYQENLLLIDFLIPNWHHVEPIHLTVYEHVDLPKLNVVILPFFTPATVSHPPQSIALEIHIPLHSCGALHTFLMHFEPQNLQLENENNVI